MLSGGSSSLAGGGSAISSSSAFQRVPAASLRARSFRTVKQAKAEELIVYVGTYTQGKSKGIYLFHMDPASGRLTPAGLAAEAFMRESAAINRIVHDSVARFGGSISAEHGLGQAKREEILRYKSPLEIELMRSIKRTLDPLGIMNPGKVL